ncbi:serine hydrolase [Marinicauda algicola]|uniref:Serine hydrolase n=1 Tax=Marinicauda algicola TaxID=2029849 RepID=A0A4S2H1V7_9PROT|nr:serine hydrolase [Marinicauda algicola]TGY89575.1 serine hydrolase [Marinicauda algicola]
MPSLIPAIVSALSILACVPPGAGDPPEETTAHYADELLRRTYSADGPGAAVLVARGDTILFRGARGEGDIQSHSQLHPNSVFRIGSVTKQFTAAAVLTLVEDGRVGLDDPLSRYLSDYPNGDQITLRHLLNHTAGVRNFNNLPEYIDGIERDLTTSEIISLFRDESLVFLPGESWAYSNSGYVLLGAVIESVTGLAWHEYMAQRFFRPLGMSHTGYGHDPQFAALQVRGYRYDEDTVAPMLPMSMTQPHAAGALVSNVDDLLIWTRALHEGRILRSQSYQMMAVPEGAAAVEGVRYGFGLYEISIRQQRALRHGGRIFGFIASLTYLPGPDITVVVLENDDAHNGPEQADALTRRLVAHALDAPYPMPDAIPTEVASLEAAQGVYDFGDGVVRTIRLEAGRLTAQRNVGPRLQLTPIAADDFLYEDGFTRLQFDRDTTGAIVAARFFASGDGEGVSGVRISTGATPPPTGLELPSAVMERFVGIYANSELSVSVTLEGETLLAQIAGQPSFRLLAASPTLFDVEEAGASVEFVPASGPVLEMVIRQNGRETVLARTP